MNKKPKCRGCNKIGESHIYYWQENRNRRGDEPAGYLWHYECFMETGILINNNLNE